MVKILDSTLREGEQTPGVCFDAHIKMAIASLLDEVGVNVIEAGHPAVTGEIRKSVAEIAACDLDAVIGAHARSLNRDIELALECDIGLLGIFYCVSENRLRHHARDLVAATDQICEVIARAREARPNIFIRFTPEDTVRSRWENVVSTAAAAVEAGADIISVADTTGYLIPGTAHNMYATVCRLREGLCKRGFEPTIAAHCHNDRGMALANALDAIRAGAGLIDATVLGLGERAGLVDLGTLLAVLASDFGHTGRWELKKLVELYRLVSRFSGIPIPVTQPVTGANAFTHCAGVHTQAALVDPCHYQSLDPEPIGRTPRVCLDHMSGLASVQHTLDIIGENSDDRFLTAMVLDRIKEIGQTGRIVDVEELSLIVDHLRRTENMTETLATAGASQ